MPEPRLFLYVALGGALGTLVGALVCGGACFALGRTFSGS